MGLKCAEIWGKPDQYKKWNYSIVLRLLMKRQGLTTPPEAFIFFICSPLLSLSTH